jgi:pseudouridine-5'-phosphate glycosidase/pseudouridine kinase
MDISADLQDLARCPVGLVSAGVKSILDIGRYTFHEHIFNLLLLNFVHLQNFGIPCMFAPLDYSSFVIQYEQETLGVPVVTYGETQDFPAFYSPSSGFKVRLRFSSVNSTMRSTFSEFRAHGESVIQLPQPIFFVRGPRLLPWLFLKILAF